MKPVRAIRCVGCGHCENIDAIGFNYAAPVECEARIDSLLSKGELLRGCAFSDSTVQRIIRSVLSAKEYFRDIPDNILRDNIDCHVEVK